MFQNIIYAHRVECSVVRTDGTHSYHDAVKVAVADSVCMLDRTPGMNGMKLFRSQKVLLEDGLQEAGILVGQEGKIDRILRKDELATLQHNAEVGMHHVYTLVEPCALQPN
jgi:hypothetical protein